VIQRSAQPGETKDDIQKAVAVLAELGGGDNRNDLFSAPWKKVGNHGNPTSAWSSFSLALDVPDSKEAGTANQPSYLEDSADGQQKMSVDSLNAGESKQSQPEATADSVRNVFAAQVEDVKEDVKEAIIDMVAHPTIEKEQSTSLVAILEAARQKAWRSGKAGLIAGVAQVLAFMWLRTTMNYQSKNGGSFPDTLRKLWAEGGIARLYRGLLPWAIIQTPLSRFGDVAANTMVLSVLSVFFPTVPVAISTFGASLAGGCWRVLLTPIDTCKTTMQTDGDRGGNLLMDKMKAGGPFVLWQGWEANYLANVAGSYPWFLVFNFLSLNVPLATGGVMVLVRSAALGAAASSASDLVSNSIRVVKTKKQTDERADITYLKAAREVVEADGVQGLFFRGLETRILTNVLQGAVFTVLWKSLQGAM
jgi:hypothetical protein